MPARWQSSQRPLFVRTVWVAGRRHAILSRDDPLLHCSRRPTSSNSTSDFSSDTSSCCQLEDCLVKLRLALQPDSYQGKYQESIFPIQQGTIEASPCFHHENPDSLYEEELPQQKLPLLGQYPKVYSLDGVDHGATFLPDLQLNPLSERVLQWLDLSGKGRRLNTANAPQRKHFTTDVRKSHTSRRKELPTRSLSVDMSANIRLSARNIVEARCKHKKSCEIKVVSPECSDSDVCQIKGPPEDPPVIQTFESPRLTRPASSWHHPPPSSSPSPNRPQLHIFMPPLEDSETESNVGEDT